VNFELTEEQLLVRATARRFAEERVRPRARDIDREDEFPWDLYRSMGELGLLGMTLPTEYGGSGADNVAMSLVIEELAKVLGSLANALLLAKLQSEFILRFGSDAQRRRWCPAIAAGDCICLIAATEPEAGSDVAGIQTIAVRDGEQWILNGVKAFMTAGQVASLAVVLAKTDPAAGHRGISTFLVEKSPDGDPEKGFVIDHKDELLGMRGLATAGISFIGTRIPAENLLGEVGEGFKYAMKSFDTGRIMIASLALGLAVGALEEVLRYARDRRAFGRPIADFQAVQLMLADMAVEVDAARLLVHRAAWLKDRGAPFSMEAAQAKLFASDVAVRAGTTAVQILGGYGYTKESPAERIYRDSKLTQIYEGTNQIQRLVIARHLLHAN
jgi:alkylation response protein AidB-like acyl-CoA dehydrogenase